MRRGCCRPVAGLQDVLDEFSHMAPRHRGLMLLFAGLLWQDVIHDSNRVCHDMTMRRSPLHDGVHPLPRAAGRFGLR
jgi:hypothetical protein